MVTQRKRPTLSKADLQKISKWLKTKSNVISSPGGAMLNELGKEFRIEGVELIDDAAVRQGDDLAILFNLFLHTTLANDDWRSDGATGTVVVRKTDHGVVIRAARIEGIEGIEAA